MPFAIPDRPSRNSMLDRLGYVKTSRSRSMESIFDPAARHAASSFRAPCTHWAFVAAITWSLRNFAWVNLCCLLLVLTGTHRQEGAPSLLAIFAIANGAAFLLWLVIAPRKHRARDACNIIFLRGFRQEARADVPNRVLPCIGCYGRLMWLRNTVKVVEQDKVGFLTGETITDAGAQPLSNDDWHAALQTLLRQADLAVVDFSVLSDNLMWEIEQCLQQMPAERIVLIAELTHHARSNFQAVCERFPELWDVPSPIPIYPSRFVIPGAFWKWWLFQYERRMHHRMKLIARQSPAPRLAGRDVEKEPKCRLS
jgi:hypothetical protein